MAPFSIHVIYNSFSKASGCVCPSDHKKDFTSTAQGTQKQRRVDHCFICCYALLRTGKKWYINSKQSICLASIATLYVTFQGKRSWRGVSAFAWTTQAHSQKPLPPVLSFKWWMANSSKRQKMLSDQMENTPVHTCGSWYGLALRDTYWMAPRTSGEDVCKDNQCGTNNVQCAWCFFPSQEGRSGS